MTDERDDIHDCVLGNTDATGDPSAPSGRTATRIESPVNLTAEDRLVAKLIEASVDAPELAGAVDLQEAPDAAATLESLTPVEATDVIEEMDIDAASEALAYMPTPLAVGMVEDLIDGDNFELAGKLLEEMAPDDATDILQAMPRRERERLLAVMASGHAHRIRELMTYPPQSAGGMMTTQYLAVRDHMTVGEATEVIRRTPTREQAQSAFVLDRKGHLVGTTGLLRLLLAKSDEKVAELCERQIDAIAPELDREQVAHEFERYRYVVLPVVDASNRLLGVVTVDDVIDIIRAEGTEDAQRMVGAGREEAVYSDVAVKFKGRFPWLLVNLFTSSLGAFVVFSFDEAIQTVAFLAVMMPVIANQSGNAGQQSLAVTLRGIVLEQVRAGRALPHVLREGSVGLINGALCGIMVGCVVALYGVVTGSTWHLGVVVAVSMTLTLVIACITGASLPLIMRRIGFDPATASTIFLTMITDSVSFFVFLGLASLLLNWVK
ncbi:MAG: magnesium transporter [Phycisphaerales bacterium]|nr:magnesium transporter [Phycisphaerales bacterium]